MLIQGKPPRSVKDPLRASERSSNVLWSRSPFALLIVVIILAATQPCCAMLHTQKRWTPSGAAKHARTLNARLPRLDDCAGLPVHLIARAGKMVHVRRAAGRRVRMQRHVPIAYLDTEAVRGLAVQEPRHAQSTRTRWRKGDGDIPHHPAAETVATVPATHRTTRARSPRSRAVRPRSRDADFEVDFGASVIPLK